MMNDEDFDEVADEIEESIEDAMSGRTRRFGAYVARATGVAATWRRLQISPDWYPEGALERVRRVSSPILDVVEAAGMRLAVTSHDGVPELPVVLGRIWDEKVAPMTVWIRAYLDTHPGRIEVGATKSVKITAGADSGWAVGGARAQVDETVPDGAVVIEATVYVGGADASKAPATVPELHAELVKIATNLNQLNTFANGVAPGSATLPYAAPVDPTTLGASKVKVK